MLEKMTKILKENTGLDFGFCPFFAVSENLIDCAAKNRLPKNSKTIISFVFPYKCKENAPLNISRYAAVSDYHNVVKNKLERIKQILQNEFKDSSFECFVDNSPIPEVRAAAYCGLGIIGKNNLLITKKWGSNVFLSEIITDIDIKIHPTNLIYCENCGKCAEICPTGRLKNKENPCLSDITQKKKLTDLEMELIKNQKSVWGCDLCQECCPLNMGTKTTEIKEFLEDYRDFYKPDEDNKNRAYNWRGEKIIKRNYELVSKSKQS